MSRDKLTKTLAIANTYAALPVYHDGIIRAIVLVVPTVAVATDAVALTFAAATHDITRSDPGGSFLDDGFQPGMHVKTDADINTGGAGGFTIVDVTDTVLTGLALEIADEGPVTKTVTAVTASKVTKIEVMDDDGDVIYTNDNSSNGWTPGTYLIESLTIPCAPGYTVKATLDAYCGSEGPVLKLKAVIE